jgi:hypothetical protein
MTKIEGTKRKTAPLRAAALGLILVACGGCHEWDWFFETRWDDGAAAVTPAPGGDSASAGADASSSVEGARFVLKAIVSAAAMQGLTLAATPADVDHASRVLTSANVRRPSFGPVRFRRRAAVASDDVGGLPAASARTGIAARPSVIARRADVAVARAWTGAQRPTTTATQTPFIDADEVVLDSSDVVDVAAADDVDATRAPNDAGAAVLRLAPALILALPAALLAILGFRTRSGRRQPSRTPARRR